MGNHSVAENAGGVDDWYMERAASGVQEDAGNHAVTENAGGMDIWYMERAASGARVVKTQPLDYTEASSGWFAAHT